MKKNVKTYLIIAISLMSISFIYNSIFGDAIEIERLQTIEEAKQIQQQEENLKKEQEIAKKNESIEIEKPE